jgi:hypothetical protein
MSWKDWNVGDVSISSGQGIPEIPDDLYDAMIREVTEPVTEPDPYNAGRQRTQFYMVWEITDGDYAGQTLRQYLSIPNGLDQGYINDKSNLFAVMDALGFDMTQRVRVEPWTWEQMTARILVENKPNREGEPRPRVTGVKASRKKTPAARASGGTLRDRLQS